MIFFFPFFFFFLTELERGERERVEVVLLFWLTVSNWY